ncbi:fimbrial outer membrane usher protein [Erwinia amylovora]
MLPYRSPGVSRSPRLALLVFAFTPAQVWAEDYWFDPSLFQGSAYGQNLAQFNQTSGTITPGSWQVDIFVNQNLVKSSEKIAFLANPRQQNRLEPCLPAALIHAAQIIPADQPSPDTAECRFLSDWLPEASWQFEQSSLRLQLSVPMQYLARTPRGYIPPSEWDSGALALFLRHNTNYTFTENTDNHFRYNYLWSGIHSGANLGLWQFRHQGNLRYVDSSIGGSAYRYNAVRSWIQHPIAALNSTLTLGDGYTDSSLFGSLSFNGIKLATDERMWPQGKRGYAPEVRGTAVSSARVIVRQLGKVIYETTVAPGPFLINDLYNTKNQGDLDVEIVEANGKSSTYTVPYSAVPDSVRPGNWHYSLALGRVRQYYSVDNTFFEGVLQRGISNSITANVGSRVADDYQALLLGGVWSTRMGAFGLNTTWSHARVENDSSEQGWRAETSYSKTFSSGTNLVLAAYRYSTSGFRDLQDVLGVRRQQYDGTDYYSDTLSQRNRLSATVSQPFDSFGTLNLSASTADYYNNQSRITQLQLGYSNQWRQISYNINVARQRTSWDNGRFNYSVNDDTDSSSQRQYTENTLSLSISMPLNWGESRSSVAFNFNQSRSTRSGTTSLTGTAGENSDLSWSAYGGYERYRDGSGEATTWGANAQQNTRVGGLRGSWDQGSGYRQLGLGASGTLVMHSGGITLGPYASDTFALIHADGAQGATVLNGQGAVIDSAGYAILPSLSPYRKNTITLDTRRMNPDVELNGGSKLVVPYAGAIARVNLATLKGKAVLITVSSRDGTVLPMGAEVFDAEGTAVGMVGQGGQIYARIASASGTLKVKWGNNGSQQCLLRYQLPARQSEAFIQLTQTCEKG